MCGIAGYCDFTSDFTKEKEKHEKIVRRMGQSIVHRGPDNFGVYIGEHAAFSHTRLAVVDIEGGAQPMSAKKGEWLYSIIYNGEIYNTKEVRDALQKKGYSFSTYSDTEVVLKAYMEYGKDCGKYLNGIYAFAVWDSCLKRVFLCRDRFGIKPLFYGIKENGVFFASEIKAILSHPQWDAKIDTYGLCEIFGLGPARSTGNGVFQGIHEIPPGYQAIVDYSGMELECYWQLEAAEHTDNYKQTVEKTRELLIDSIERQLVGDVPLCTLLSGGIDSSIVSAVSARALKREGKCLDTYSFDYVDNAKYFQASKFQPSQDRPYVDIMVKAIGSNHTYLQCDHESLYQALFDAVYAKDLPGMADVDSSMLYFCRQIKKRHTVCLSGECADEIFGGYPWFQDPDAFSTRAFPWSKDLSVRKSVINKSLLEKLPLDEYVQSRYEKTISQVPALYGEDKTEARRREIGYLNIRWFMTTLLDRKDRTTMASGLEVRVPFADHRLVQYVYNVPWEFKNHDNVVKGLLRDASAGLLPDEVLYRRKSPYPKTYNPQYEKLLKQKLTEVLEDKDSRILPLVDKEMLYNWMRHPSDYGKPWFGQLMAVPQMYAYLIMMEAWMRKYEIELLL